jgi:putative hydrolase of HD superfamily
MAATTAETIHRQLIFLAELDRLKSIIRQSPLINRTRKENSAEHSWHLAMFALVLGEHAEGIDQDKLIRMLLLHDIVEIDAGDAPIHAVGTDREALEHAEKRAAERIFSLLPPSQGQEMLTLWLEFEAAETPTARFAKGLDRLQPLFLNTLTNGGTWTENRVTEQQVLERYGPTIELGSPVLWEEARKLVRLYFAERARSP